MRVRRSFGGFRVLHPVLPGLLAQASYMIADEVSGQAVVVDPRRDDIEYLAVAEACGFTVVGVINTHFHADFVAGHLEMAARTGAWIGYGRRAETEYAVRRLGEGERVRLGEVTVEVMETSGHTPESVSFSSTSVRATRCRTGPDRRRPVHR